MRFPSSLLIACLTLAACQASPPGTAPERPAVPLTAATAAAIAPSLAPVAAPPLAHDGGIVYWKPLDALKDPAVRARAQALGTDLTQGLRLERTLRDAELLLASQPAAAYALLSDEEDAGEADDDAQDAADDAADAADDASDDAEDTAADDATGAETDDDHTDDQDDVQDPEAEGDDEDDDEQAEEAAKAAWKKLSSDERKRVEAAVKGREAKLLVKLAAKLARKTQRFAKQSDDAVVTGADGARVVTSRFALSGATGSRAVTVVRKFDAAGTLVQAVQTLAGTSGTTTYAATRTRTIHADGSVSIVSDTTLTVAGQASVLHWEKTIAPDGTLTATGTLTRADGTTVALSAKGTEDGLETIYGNDAGVAITLAADAASGAATATVDAGEAGSVVVTVDADDEDDDEGDVDDDEDEDVENDDEDEDETEQDEVDRDEADQGEADQDETYDDDDRARERDAEDAVDSAQ